MQIKHIRKPDWFKVKIPGGKKYGDVEKLLKEHRLHSICQEASCPNIHECWNAGTATFLILGDICTRNCSYCNVKTGRPEEVDLSEPQRLAFTVKKMGLKYVVITSVTRDDLEDGGASVYAESVKLLKEQGLKVELLIPDFLGNEKALNTVLESKPDVLSHNIEIVKEFYPKVRKQGNYQRALNLLEKISRAEDVISKTAFMVGIGETMDEIENLLKDLAKVKVQRLAIGQYLQPTKNHWPVSRYYTLEEFDNIKSIVYDMGFSYVECGPLVRSSYHAEKAE